MHYGDGWMWGMHWAGWFFWIVGIGALVYLVARLSDRSTDTSRTTPREILDRRYAAGEISSEEYEERKAKLK